MSSGDRNSVAAQQLLGMRQFVGLEGLGLDDAAKMLGVMTERSLPAGTRLAQRGTPLNAAWFIVEGQLEIGAGKSVRRAGEREPVGLLEALADLPEGIDVTCVGPATVLELPKASLVALLRQDFDALAGAMRSTAAAILQLSDSEPISVRAVNPLGPAPLSFAERLLFLTDLSTFTSGGAETVAEIAFAMSDVAMNGVVLRAGEASDCLYIVMTGALHYRRLTISAGNVFGALHGIGEIPVAADLTAEPGTRVLACRVETILDLLEDDLPLALAWLRGFAALLSQLIESGGSGESV